ncbi:flagellar biosynthesis anti-sigma factor FlgM [Candidatus Caldatribacterium sp.]|uniref:flagellar biosynthesis anti-sigma factor FlgM n=1 Tax=Candidatus Caldatribacterium sp. TaxID=2282143 RepID=UPI00299B1126|nr:flagellar biosynthesis anti-sigma factor FlgM [Candidatus Caldatribacterium sp.]MDW8081949.1 flagellar biosynthesis anti-sigma factor FlgM [Candidatus Calescibacterium sp.]
MKISGNQVESLLRVYLERTQGERKKVTSSPSSQVDSLTLSPEAQETAVLQDRLREIPPSRQELVAALRERIAAGQYHPSGIEVARKMLYREAVDFIVSEGERVDHSA